MSIQNLPPMERYEKNVRDEEGSLLISHGYKVASWRPGEAGSGEPATEVHVILPIPIVKGVEVVLRLKSARALDELVGILLQYRQEVWGGNVG